MQPTLDVNTLCSLGLEKVAVPDGAGFGIFNGQHFVFRSSAISILTKIRMLFRYGFSLFSVNRHVDDMLEHFSRIYSLQQHKGQTFYTVPDMLKAMGGSNFYHMTQVCVCVWFKAHCPHVTHANKWCVIACNHSITANRNIPFSMHHAHLCEPLAWTTPHIRAGLRGGCRWES